MNGSSFTEEELLETLGEAQRLGFLGPAPLPEIVRHARQFVAALPDDAQRVVDVGAGGGTPGLVIAQARPDVELVLIDRRAKRTDALARWVNRLGIADRVRVRAGDAVRWARTPELRQWADVAVARGLGAPGLTAELTRGFLRPGGVLVVSEPPSGGGPSRWPAAGLIAAGFLPIVEVLPGVVRLTATADLPEWVPRPRPRPLRF